MRRAAAAIATLACVALPGCGDALCAGGGISLVCAGYSPDEPDRAPVAAFELGTASVTSGDVVRFDASGSRDDVHVALYEWDLNGVAADGPGAALGTGNPYEVRTTTPVLEHQVLADTAETRTIRLRVTDNRERRATAERTLAIEPAAGPVNLMPRASVTAAPNPARRGEVVSFDASGSSDPEGGRLTFRWDLDGDGDAETSTGTTPTASWIYETPGTRTVSVTATDPEGLAATTAVEIQVRKGGPRSAAAATGRAFSARLAAYPLGRRRSRGLVLAGGLHARLGSRADPGPAIRALLDSRVVARIDIARDRRRLSGTALVVGDGAAVCARLRMSRVRGRRPTGYFRVIGGRGTAESLRASGRFSYAVGSGVVRLGGRVRWTAGEPRELPRRCLALLAHAER